MPKLLCPHSPDQLKIAQLRQDRREILDKAWIALVILALLAIVVYSVVIQILHHP